MRFVRHWCCSAVACWLGPSGKHLHRLASLAPHPAGRFSLSSADDTSGEIFSNNLFHLWHVSRGHPRRARLSLRDMRHLHCSRRPNSALQHYPQSFVEPAARHVSQHRAPYRITDCYATPSAFTGFSVRSRSFSWRRTFHAVCRDHPGQAWRAAVFRPRSRSAPVVPAASVAFPFSRWHAVLVRREEWAPMHTQRR